MLKLLVPYNLAKMTLGLRSSLQELKHARSIPLSYQELVIWNFSPSKSVYLTFWCPQLFKTKVEAKICGREGTVCEKYRWIRYACSDSWKRHFLLSVIIDLFAFLFFRRYFRDNSMVYLPFKLVPVKWFDEMRKAGFVVALELKRFMEVCEIRVCE